MAKTKPFTSILQKYPFFLVTIPFVFLINTVNHYFKLLHWEFIIEDLAIYLVVPVIIYFLLGIIWRSYKKSGVLMFFLLIIFYFFHLFYEWLRAISFLSFIAKYTILLPALLAVQILLIIYLRKKKNGFDKFYYRANLIFFLLLAGGLIQYCLLNFDDTAKKNDQADPSKNLVKKFLPCDSCERPDIYFIIFDEYTNSKTLNKEFDYSNTFIEDKLRSKQFFIPPNSKSNYNFTHMSIGSELNLDYLNNLDNTKRFYTKDFFKAYYSVFNNELCMMLKKQGYEINNYSIFDIGDAPIKPTPMLTAITYRSVFGQTFFNKLKRDIGWHFIRFFQTSKITKREHKKINGAITRINETLNSIIKSAKKPSPKPQFVYAHFLLPHETYYYDSNGKRLNSLYTARTTVNKKAYLNQLIYTNKFIMAPLVDSVFKYSKKPFILVIQGDHGYRNYPSNKLPLEFENFTALYFPDKDYSTITNSFSSVNTFRFIFNKFFKQNMSILKDTTISLYKQNSY